MPTRPKTFRCRPARSKADRDRAADARRGTAAARGYGAAWNRASEAFRHAHPFCDYCDLEGRTAATDCTDHLYPASDPAFAPLFWREEWWVASCNPCHAGFKQRIEREGRAVLDALCRRLGRPTPWQAGALASTPDGGG